MDSKEIIARIRVRRDSYRDAIVFAAPNDPLVCSGAGVCWHIAEEYDELLAEIQAGDQSVCEDGIR